MNLRGSDSLLARLLRRALRPAWLQRARQRQTVRRGSPTAIVHRGAVVDGSELGRFVLVDGGVWIYGSTLGDYSYVADGARVARTHAGRFCSVAPGAYVGLPQHPSRGFISSHPIFYQRVPSRGLDFADRNYFEGFAPTEVGHDVWIGAHALVKGGLTIGSGAIVGAGAVVTRDVPPYAVVVGTPARISRYRFNPAEIEFLLAFRWWDKDEAWLRANWQAFHHAESFLERFGPPLA